MRSTLFILSLLGISIVLGQNQTSSRQDYNSIIQELESSIDPFSPSATSYYNLGTAYLNKNQLGKARLYLERAYLLDPGDKLILNNLQIVINRANTEIIELKGFFVNRWLDRIVLQFSSSAWALLSLLFFIATMAIIYFKWIKGIQSNTKLNIGLWLSLILAVLTAIFSYLNYDKIHLSDHAIILQSNSLVNDPIEKTTIITLGPGVKIEVINPEEEWSKVKTMDLQEGWIKTSSYEKI